MGFIIRVLSRFIVPAFAWLAKWFAWLVPVMAWFKRTWSFVLNKLLVAYFGSRLWLTVTMVAFAVGLVTLISTTIGYLVSVMGQLFIESSGSLDSNSMAFLSTYVTFDWLFEMLGFGVSAWVSYLSIVKSLVAMKYTHKLFNYVSKSIK